MFIQEVIIDGFKSYARKTTVEGYVGMMKE
jgi:chromosome segregation ATPase